MHPYARAQGNKHVSDVTLRSTPDNPNLNSNKSRDIRVQGLSLSLHIYIYIYTHTHTFTHIFSSTTHSHRLKAALGDVCSSMKGGRNDALPLQETERAKE